MAKPSVTMSKTWDARFHGTGKQHTIYAPKAFFDAWVGDDSPLKKLVNAWLLENMGETAEAPTPAKKPAKSAKPPKPAKTSAPGLATDDDI